MNKTFVAFVIAASLAACGKKDTTPVKSPAMEQTADATGGASYGGRKATAPKDPPKDPAPSAK